MQRIQDDDMDDVSAELLNIQEEYDKNSREEQQRDREESQIKERDLIKMRLFIQVHCIRLPIFLLNNQFFFKLICWICHYKI